MAPKFTQVTSRQVKNTLVRRFIPLADQLRDLLTKFGLRTYSVKVVRIQWSGGERGVGTPVVVKETLIEPTPKIGDFAGIAELVQSVGLDEVGSIELTRVSGRYTEEELRGQNYFGEQIPFDEEVFYEIEFPRPDDGPSLKRRFFIRSAPQYKPGSLAWSVRLEKAHEDRTRQGDPE